MELNSLFVLMCL